MFRPRARLVSDWVQRLELADRAVFADIGSGYGIFLEEIAATGTFARVIGVEPAPNLAEICRWKGFSVIEFPDGGYPARDLQVSFATAFEVLEHVRSRHLSGGGSRRVRAGRCDPFHDPDGNGVRHPSSLGNIRKVFIHRTTSTFCRWKG